MEPGVVTCVAYTRIMRLPCLLSALIFSLPLLTQTTLVQENFDAGNFPDSWTQQTLASDGGWLVGDNQALQSQWWTIAPHGSFIATNDDGCDCDKSADYLIMPELDMTGLEQAVLAFSSYYDGGEFEGATEVATVEYSLDGGETWAVLETISGSDNGEWGFDVLSLNALLGESSVMLAFHYNDNGGWLYGWGLDDVSVFEPTGLDLSLTNLAMEPVVFAPSAEDLSGTVVNLGQDSIYSYTIEWSFAGESGSTTVDGVSLGTGDVGNFSVTSALDVSNSGSLTIEATITNVNGVLDDIVTNNTLSVSATAVLAAQYSDGKLLRDYLYYHPSDAPENCPLVFVYHGYTGDALSTMQYTGFNALADENGFAVCYPQGSFDGDGEAFWNVGYAFHQNEFVDDVAFTLGLRAFLIEENGLDSDRVFATGFSNGADFSYLLACEASADFRAVAPIAGILMEDIRTECAPGNMVPILEIHGTTDNVSLYEGDMQNVDGWGAYPSTPDAMAFFVNLFGIALQEAGSFPDTNPGDDSTVDYQKWGADGSCAQVWLYTVNGGGHSWPGVWGNQDINASQEAWDFFVQSCNQVMSVDEQPNAQDKTLVKVVDLLGREATVGPGQLLLHVYSDGSVEKRMSGE